MTSPSFNARKRAAEAEMTAFSRLPKSLQIAISSAAISVQSRTVFDALMRGVSEEKLLETIKAAGQKDKS